MRPGRTLTDLGSAASGIFVRQLNSGYPDRDKLLSSRRVADFGTPTAAGEPDEAIEARSINDHGTDDQT
jgi:hypothetical protein